MKGVWRDGPAFDVLSSPSTPLTRSATERFKLFWCSIPKTTVRPIMVVVHPPALDLPTSVIQRAKPVRFQALVAQAPVKAPHDSVLHRPPRLNVPQPDLVLWKRRIDRA